MGKERAQGNGATTVRVMRQRSRARRGAGIPATKYRAADGGCSAREESRFSPKRETNTCAVSPAPEGAMRGFVSGRSRYPPKRSEVAEGDVNQGCGTFESETITAGLAPEAVYVYGERGEGRRNRPLSQGEHGYPKQSRTMSGKPTPSTKHGLQQKRYLPL